MSSPSKEASPSPSSAHFAPERPSSLKATDPSTILIKVLSPAENLPTDLAFRVLPKSTIGELKNNISATLDSRPANDQQRLIYRGKVLADELVIETVLGLGPGKDGAAGETPQDTYIFHLVIRASIDSPIVPNAPPNASLGSSFLSNPPPLLVSPSLPANGPVTTTSALPRGANGPSVAGIGGAPGFAPMSLDELRQALRQRPQDTEQQQENVAARQGLAGGLTQMGQELGQRITTAGQSVIDTSGMSTGISIPGLGSSGSGSISKTQTTRYGPSGISASTVASGSGAVTSSSGGFPGAPISERVNQILEIEDDARRRALLELQQEEIEQSPETVNLTATSSTQDTLPAFYPSVQPVAQNNLLGGNNLIYLLQDASGVPTALLVGPPGSARSPTPAPIPGANINWAAGRMADIPANLRALGWPLADNINLGAHGNNILQNGGFGFQNPQARVALNLNRNRRINLGEVLARVRARATHFWLAVRLVVFVVLFTGSGGWRRMLYLGSIAILIFIWQTGVFNDFFRPLAEAINPQAPRPNPNPVAATPAAAVNPNPNPNPNPPHQPLARDTNGNPIGPVHTAEILVARREDRLRDMIRGVERGVTIFLASLIPGLHERHVDAVEARQREVQQLRGAQGAVNVEAAGAAVEGQVPAGEDVPGAVPPQAPVVEAGQGGVRGLL